MRRTCFFLFLSGLSVCAYSISATEASGRQARWETESYYHENRIREYRVRMPADPVHPMPVVMLLHEGGESMDDILNRGKAGARFWEDLADEQSLLLLFPNGTNPRTGSGRGARLWWNDCRPDTRWKGRRSEVDDVGFLLSVVERVGMEYPVDLQRVYVSGSGEGGMMALRLAWEAGGQIAGAALFHTSLPLNSICHFDHLSVPVWMLNGTRDPVFAWRGGNILGREGRIMSVEQAKWTLARLLGASHRPGILQPYENRSPDDASRAFQTLMPAQSENAADFCFVEVEGGGHLIPSTRYSVSRRTERRLGPLNRDIEAVEEAWNFLKHYRLGETSRSFNRSQE